MQSLSMSNKTLSDKMKKINLYLIIFYLVMYAFDLCFIFSIIRYDKFTIEDDEIRGKMKSVYWDAYVAIFSVLYINLKSILCINLVGVEISIIIRIYNTLFIFLVSYVESEYFVEPEPKLFCFYLSCTIVEIIITVLYRIKVKRESAYFTFKSIGASITRRNASYIRNSIKLILEILFIKQSASFISDCSNYRLKSLVVTFASYIFKISTLGLTMAALQVRNDFMNRVCRVLYVINSYVVIELVLHRFFIQRAFSIDTYRVCDYTEKVFLYVFTIKYLREYKKFQKQLLEDSEYKRRLHL